ncbi:hypothetical protein F8M41_022357 [Gigaspora margarita]|uniref:Uncharacterized protein n=1 Tax=Gigaspora margarita TaxID=4874 RepID=A0A8H4AF65_GIGMA|nr:hypothetical protein F8M41_022357 [Gigaspora margarita]
MRLVSEFIETGAIDKLYYFKSLKDICVSFLACTAKEAEKQIKSFYKEQTDPFKQTTLDSFSLLKRKNSEPIPIEKRTKYNPQIESSKNGKSSSSKTKRKRSIDQQSNITTKKAKITDYFTKMYK